MDSYISKVKHYNYYALMRKVYYYKYKIPNENIFYYLFTLLNLLNTNYWEIKQKLVTYITRKNSIDTYKYYYNV